MDSSDADYRLALSLQEQFDSEQIVLSSGDEVEQTNSDHLLAQQLQKTLNQDNNITLSDDDDDEISISEIIPATIPPANTAAKLSNRSVKSEDDEISISEIIPVRIPPRNAVTNLSNTSAIMIDANLEDDDVHKKDFYIDELQTYVDPKYNSDWHFIEVRPDIKAIFQKFDENYFQNKLKKLNVTWSRIMGTCTNRNYNDEENTYTICLSEPLLCLRPRIDLISILLHEMIHAYLKIAGVREENNGHGPNFKKIMYFLNKKIMTNITVNHRFQNQNDEYNKQWYRCTGICTNYRPFFGISRSVEGVPSTLNEWWKCHQDNCGGTFFKLFEMTKKVSGGTLTRYAVHVNYIVPTRESLGGGSRYKTSIRPKMSIDLTSGSPVLIHNNNNIETIPLLEDEEDPNADVSIANQFIAKFNQKVAFTHSDTDLLCPICQEKIKRKLLHGHLDGCRGYVQNIKYPKRKGTFICRDGDANFASTSSIESLMNPSSSAATKRYKFE